jgi:cellulase/cellobiase CelA1
MSPSSNLFATHDFYVNPQYQERVRASIAKTWADGTTRASLRDMLDSGSAFWIDTISRIRDAANDVSLESVFYDAASRASPPLVVVILYDLPNRSVRSRKAAPAPVRCG